MSIERRTFRRKELYISFKSSNEVQNYTTTVIRKSPTDQSPKNKDESLLKTEGSANLDVGLKKAKMLFCSIRLDLSRLNLLHIHITTFYFTDNIEVIPQKYFDPLFSR